jgi:tRNA nucleotidyltransferase (CCA-adding enzyme)
MIAKDLMTRDVITAKPTMTVKNLASVLIKNQISGVPVASNNGRIIGVVSEADILAKKGKVVRSIMSKKVIRVSEDTPVEEVAKLMMTHKINRLPVFRGDQLVGIISRADVVGAIAMGKRVALYTPVYDL